MNRVFIIGWDGATWDLIRPWVAQGKLPHIAALMDTGATGPLESTLPPMTFPAWSSFMTGKNPGKHGIYDFTRQRPGRYELEFVNGGQAVGVIPTRYAGSEGSDDSHVALGRKTVWQEPIPEVFVGLGQRVLATDGGEHPLMEIRAIVIDGAETVAGAADA